MKFYIKRTSGQHKGRAKQPIEGATRLPIEPAFDWDGPLWGIEIATIEDLVALMEKADDPLIILPTYEDKSYSKYCIEIYDYYRE